MGAEVAHAELHHNIAADDLAELPDAIEHEKLLRQRWFSMFYNTNSAALLQTHACAYSQSMLNRAGFANMRVMRHRVSSNSLFRFAVCTCMCPHFFSFLSPAPEEQYWHEHEFLFSEYGDIWFRRLQNQTPLEPNDIVFGAENGCSAAAVSEILRGIKRKHPSCSEVSHSSSY